MDKTPPADSIGLHIPKMTQGPSPDIPVYFQAPFPLEACVLYLENKKGKGKHISSQGAKFPVEIDVIPVTEDSYRYTLLMTIQGPPFSQKLDVGIEGFLQRWDENFTLVVGKTWASIRYFWLVPMCLAIPVGIYVEAYSHFVLGWVAGIGMVMGSVVYWLYDHWRIGSAHQKLLAFLQNTLEAGKPQIAVQRVADEKQLEEEYQE